VGTTATEESNIVLVSLVRSNKHGSMGFLSDANRLNIILSRAKHDMILFGDLHFLTTGAHKSEAGRQLWSSVQSLLEAGGHVYTEGVPLVCSRHPHVHSDAATPEQFAALAPNGGCTEVPLLLYDTITAADWCYDSVFVCCDSSFTRETRCCLCYCQ
jgi:AAA domain